MPLPVRDPSHLGLEAFKVVFLPLQVGFGDEYGKVAVAHAEFLEARVEKALNALPDSV